MYIIWASNVTLVVDQGRIGLELRNGMDWDNPKFGDGICQFRCTKNMYICMEYVYIYTRFFSHVVNIVVSIYTYNRHTYVFPSYVWKTLVYQKVCWSFG